jgi:hypothetical protein
MAGSPRNVVFSVGGQFFLIARGILTREIPNRYSVAGVKRSPSSPTLTTREAQVSSRAGFALPIDSWIPFPTSRHKRENQHAVLFNLFLGYISYFHYLNFFHHSFRYC